MDTNTIKPVYQKCRDCCIQKIIEARAFEIYEYRQENGLGGSHWDDWYQAEREVMMRLYKAEPVSDLEFNA